MDYQQVPVKFRRAIGVAGVIMILILAVGSAALAAPNLADDATLTLAKVTTPAGGQDFPVSAVGYVGTFLTSFDSPRDVELDNSGHIYVVGYKVSKVEVFDETGTSLGVWGTKGHDQQEMFRPEDIAVIDDGVDITVIVADTGNSRLQFYDEEGTYIRTIGSLGTGDGQFSGPQGVVSDPDGNIYVADTNNHRIQVLDSDGNFLRKWGSQGSAEGQFSFPAGVDIGPDGNLYVADSNNHRIQVFTADGTFLRAFGHDGTDPGEFHYPTHLAVADDGTVFVSDTYNQRVEKLTADGRFLTMWGTEGTGPGQFERPNGLFVAPNGLVLVVDIDNARIQSFRQVTAFLDDGEEESFVLPSATYQITEPVEDGWERTGVTCEGADVTDLPTGVELLLENDAPVKCTFANESDVETGSISAFKYHDLDLSGTNTVGDLPLSGWTFRLRDDEGVQVGDDVLTDELGLVNFEALFPGDYQVCELLPADWFNTEPGDAGQPILGTGGEVCGPAAVLPGAATDVQFGNVAAATLTVAKVTEPVGSTEFFEFMSDVPELSGSLMDGQQFTATVWPGSYLVAEVQISQNYFLSAVTCDDTDSVGDVVAGTAVFEAAPGEVVTCTFTNTVNPILTGGIVAHLYEDVDEGGSHSVGDLPLAGWTINLRGGPNNDVLVNTVTDADGMASFDDLPVEDYQVCQVLQAGWINVEPGDAGQPIVGTGQELCVDVTVVADQSAEVMMGNVKVPVIESFSLYLPMIVTQED